MPGIRNNLTNTGATWTTITLDSSALAGQHVSATTDGHTSMLLTTTTQVPT